MPISQVFSFDSHKLEALLLNLSPADRRSRFSGFVKDETIVLYVKNFPWEKILVYGFFDLSGELLGFVEVVPSGESYEIALAVQSTSQGQGIGKALLQHAVLHAKIAGVKEITLFFENSNTPVQHLAKSQGLTLTREGPGVSGSAKMTPATVTEHVTGAWQQLCSTMDATTRQVSAMADQQRYIVKSIWEMITFNAIA